jgi:hypothetical protein
MNNRFYCITSVSPSCYYVLGDDIDDSYDGSIIIAVHGARPASQPASQLLIFLSTKRHIVEIELDNKVMTVQVEYTEETNGEVTDPNIIDIFRDG